MEKKKPAKKFRLGRVHASVWANERDGGSTFYNVIFSRTYKDENGFKETTSFSPEDVVLVRELAEKAANWILTAQE